jgi:hypothetical protein
MKANASAAEKLERLWALASKIREGIEKRYAPGLMLKEIRDEELYKADGFKTWAAYCREQWGMERAEVDTLIRLAETRAVLPPPPAS